MKNRVCASLLNRVTSAAAASEHIKDGMLVAMSGFSKAGYPKAVPKELVRRKENGEKLAIGLITGANVPWLDELLGTAELINRRIPMCASKVLASQINAGKVSYVEQQMSRMPRLLRNRSFGDIDVAVVEALAITEEGIIPTSSVGLSSHYLETAKEIIVEINKAQPGELFGIHDVFIPKAPPETEPVPIRSCGDRIGSDCMPVDFSKIKCIVETDIPENDPSRTSSTPELRSVAEKLISFLKTEYASKNKMIPPIQMGFGNLTNTVAEMLQTSDLTDLQFYCGGADENVLQLLLTGKASVVSTCGVAMNDRTRELLKEIPDVRNKLIIRNGDLTNNGEITSRLGIIAINTGIEIDIYGNVNASHIGGSRVVNGIGGGASFAQNSGLSVVMITSLRKDGAISNIVPMVSHQDICGHDVDVIITENGIADIRGLDDVQSAELIISKCAPEMYKKQLFDYLEAAGKAGGHHPQNPQKAFEWFSRLKETGSMLES